jgi:ectoine hydroxylase-related dioxygenase (phytanoyl-CoA dioxygenase family)
MSSWTLTPEQFLHYEECGWLLLNNLLGVPVSELQDEVGRIASRDDSDGWLHHHETTGGSRRLIRTEDFTPTSPVMNRVLRRGAVGDVAGELLGEEALLYKEKIDYKFPGGAGFSPHQDKPAYPFVDSVLSVMIAVDDATIHNGCIYLASGWHRRLLAHGEGGGLSRDVVARIDWHPVELRAGQTLFFDALTPHRSGTNRSNAMRRALHPTYNGSSQGDLRDSYYAAKRKAFAGSERGDHLCLNLIGDSAAEPL